MRASMEHLRSTFAFSQRRACGLIGVAVSTCRYQSLRNDEQLRGQQLRGQLVELARERPRQKSTSDGPTTVIPRECPVALSIGKNACRLVFQLESPLLSYPFGASRASMSVTRVA